MTHVGLNEHANECYDLPTQTSASHLTFRLRLRLLVVLLLLLLMLLLSLTIPTVLALRARALRPVQPFSCKLARTLLPRSPPQPESELLEATPPRERRTCARRNWSRTIWSIRYTNFLDQLV
jgi:hypothetical protein